MARKNPTEVTMGRAGLYVAPVDSTGMSADQKEAVGLGPKKKKPKPKGPVAWLKDKMGIQY